MVSPYPQMPLGGAPQIPRPGAGGNWRGNNANTLLMLGLGLLDKRQNNQVPFSQIGQQAMAGSQLDKERKQRNMTVEWLKRSKGLSDQDAQAAVVNPVILSQLLKGNEPIKVGKGDTLLDPTTYQSLYQGQGDREIRNDANGVPRYTDTGDAVYPSDQSASGGTQFFSGRSVEAQGLNYLLDQKILTKEQAANVAAGKTVTGPNGEIIFMTPEGIFQKPAGGGPASPVGGQSGNIQVTGPKYSEDMRKAGGFASRASAADQIIGQTDVTAAGQNLSSNLAAGIPIAGNYMVPKEFQQFDQAQRDFVNAVLRRESGAAISESEFQNARKQYFPQPGDSKEVVEQKAENRRLAIDSLHASADPVSPFGAPPAGPTDLYQKYGLEP